MRALTKVAKAFGLVTAALTSLYKYMEKKPVYTRVSLFEKVEVRLKMPRGQYIDKAPVL